MEKEKIESGFCILDQNDIMELLGIKRSTFFKLMKTGMLPVVKMGKHYYTTPRLMEQWMEKMQGHEVLW